MSRLITKSRLTLLNRTVSIALGVLLCTFSLVAATSESSLAHRPLRVAIYPIVPEKAEMFLKVLQDYRTTHPWIDLILVDIGANYYSGGLLKALKGDGHDPCVDVAEVDTIFLRDFLDQNLIDTKSFSPMRTPFFL